MPETNIQTYDGEIVREEGTETLVVIERPEGAKLALVETQALKDAGIDAGFTISITFNEAGQAIDQAYTPREIETYSDEEIAELETMLKAAETLLQL